MTLDELLAGGRPLRVLICGSRVWIAEPPITSLIARLPPGSIVIHGACGCDTRFDPAKLRGADGISDRAARWRADIEVRPYPAEWTRLGKAAGQVRNRQMYEEERPDVVVGFPLGPSPGTRGMLAIAQRGGTPAFDLGIPSLNRVDDAVVECDAAAAGGASSSSGGNADAHGQGAEAPAGTSSIVPRLLTIGYQGWKPDALGAAIVAAGAATVVDVRDHPWSPAPQWRREELERTVVAAGLRYAWAGDLVGNPRANRADTSDAGGGPLERFRTYVTAGEPSRLQRFGRRLLATTGVACLLCGCDEVEHCHRGVLVDELVRAGVVDPAGVLHLERPTSGAQRALW